jgi:enterochelin esterase-like enzyme
MQKVVQLFVLSFLISASGFGQSGKVFDQLSHTSEILKGERNFAIYLPPDYETSQRSYPVLYLLHGAGDDQTGWVQFGEVQHITDKAIKEGEATPMIIVMPDAQTTRLGFFNHIDGTWNYEDYFFKELMPYVEKTYRIKSERRYRAVAGLSMGGEGAFIYALHRPDLFSSSCPLSASVEFETYEQRERDLKAMAGKRKLTDDYIKAAIESLDVHSIIKNRTKEELDSVRWYIDCGDDDFLFEGNSLVHIALRKKDVKHEFRIRDGGHTWTYWRESLPEVLKFVSDGFHQY